MVFGFAKGLQKIPENLKEAILWQNLANEGKRLFGNSPPPKHPRF
jgi:hypothetical protein